MSYGKGKGKTIDYLFEDPEIPTQKYALVSIVGPHMPQKCNVWGLKVRGTADNLDKAKAMCKKLLRIDNHYDIYTVEVGKFFPLTVDPLEVSDVEYQNDQLNTLVKSYLENRENANELWNKRKTDMIEEAIREGKNQEEFANRPEHPISVLHRIQTYRDSIEETEKALAGLRDELTRAQQKFDGYSEEEREIASKEFKTALENMKSDEAGGGSGVEKPFTIDDIREELESELKVTYQDQKDQDVENILGRIKSLEEELEELESFRSTLSETAAPKGYATIQKQIERAQAELETLKTKLNNKDLVNEYINENYQNSQYDLDTL